MLKEVVMDNMQIVHRGDVWLRDEPPCSKSMAGLLECNESWVTWVQPAGGTMHDQFPCIILKDNRVCRLSLRMMKTIWR